MLLLDAKQSATLIPRGQHCLHAYRCGRGETVQEHISKQRQCGSEEFRLSLSLKVTHFFPLSIKQTRELEISELPTIYLLWNNKQGLNNLEIVLDTYFYYN